MAFKLTPKQEEANELLAGPATHILLRGGAGSGKTFVLVRALIIRALRAPNSTHAVLRWRFSHLVDSLINNTLPEVMALCFPGLSDACHLSKSQHGWSTTFPNGARILYGGLDDKERADKILGQQHSTIYANEATQISFDAREKAVTRIRQQSGLPLKMYYDCNPTSTGHWLFKLFEKKLYPKSGERIANPEDYVSLQMNPADNPTLPENYLKQLTSLSGKSKLRFWDGEWLPQVEGALWTFEGIDSNRITPAQLPEMERIVIAVDPSGCHGPEDTRSDEIGIVACGRGKDGRGYVLEDRSGRYSPDGWAKASLALFDTWHADRIICESNFGGAMVKHTIRTARREAPILEITASRGKVQRAEPIAALYEQGLVSHLGRHAELEEQLCNFSISGYMGQTSPDRADAAIWALTELLVKPQQQIPKVGPMVFLTPRSWAS